MQNASYRTISPLPVMYVVICQNTQLIAAGSTEKVRGVSGWIPLRSSFFATNPTLEKKKNVEKKQSKKQ